MTTTATELARAIATELELTPEQVERTIALFDEGNTMPSVCRRLAE